MTRGVKWGIGIGVFLALVLCAGGALGWGFYLLGKAAQQKEALTEAYQAVRNNDCETAIAKFDAGLRQRLTEAERSVAHANRAYCYGKLSQTEQARRDYTESIRLYPKLGWVFEARGVLHEDNGAREKALEDYTAAIQLDPNAVDVLHRRALLFLARRDFENAIEDLKEAIRVSPKSAEFYALLGEAQLSANDLERARASFDSAIDLYPNYARAWAKRAETHRLQGRPEEAASDEARARTIEYASTSFWSGLNAGPALPGTGVELITRGNSALDTGQYDAAVEFYDKALAATLSSKNAALAYMNRGNAHLRRREVEKARADYERAIKEDPRNAGARVNRASLHLGQDPNAAIAECTTAIELDPKLGEAYINRAIAFGEKQEWPQAIADFETAIKLNSPRKEVALNSLAWLRATREEDSLRAAPEAVQAATEACELTSWRNPAYLDTLAAAYAESGAFEKAVEFETKAIALLSPSRQRSNMQKRLELYQAGRPYREY